MLVNNSLRKWSGQAIALACSSATALAISFALSSWASAQVLLPTSSRVVVGTTSDAATPTGCSLRQALASLASDTDVGDCVRELQVGTSLDEIRFDPAIVPGQIFLTSQLDVTSNILIDGPGRDVFEISGSASHRILDASSADLTVRGLTLTQGRGSGDGGAIYSNGAVVIEHSRVQNSMTQQSGDSGGCIAIDGTGSLILRLSEVSGCTAGWLGGGIYVRGPFEIENSTLSDNEADEGGAILAVGDGSIDGSLIADNTSRFGSSLQTFNANISVSESTFYVSDPGAGGLIQLGFTEIDNSVIRIRNSLIHDDSSAASGTVVFDGPAFSNAVLTLENTTVTGSRGIISQNTLELLNSTVTITNSPALQIFSGSSAQARIANSIVVSDGADDCVANGATFIENSHNIYTDGDCTDAQDNLVFADPMLGPLGDNGGPTLTRAPLAGSPAINAGSVFCLGTDQRGYLRTDKLCDIGAVELGATPDFLFADDFE